jgi:hypothetical protein
VGGREVGESEGSSKIGSFMEVTEGWGKRACLRVGLLSPVGESETMNSSLKSTMLLLSDGSVIVGGQKVWNLGLGFGLQVKGCCDSSSSLPYSLFVCRENEFVGVAVFRNGKRFDSLSPCVFKKPLLQEVALSSQKTHFHLSSSELIKWCFKMAV